MSSRRLSTASCGRVPNNAGFSLTARVTRVIVLIVLTFCVNVQLICAQTTNQPSCGKRQVNSVFLVHGGVQSNLGRWPWHAAIFHQNQYSQTYRCGGTIIGRDTVLTVAHCFYTQASRLKEDDIVVHVGRVNLNKITDSLQHLSASKIITHPKFNINYGAAHDIAIVKLSSDIRMTQSVQPACLWDNKLGTIIDKTGSVIGFGRNERDQLPGFLQEATLTVVDGYTCVQNDHGTYGALLTSEMFCAGGQPGVSACNGDSGSGFFIENYGTWYMTGIVSFIATRPNTDLCDPSKYTVFTDVSKYRQWIFNNINPQKRPLSLQPCKAKIFSNEAVCNMAFRFDFGFLLVGAKSSFVRVSLNGKESYNIGLTNYLGGFDRDCANGRFYWSDKITGRIYNALYDGTDRKPIITEDIRMPSSVAVDWISRRLYWIEEKKKVIEVASLDNPRVRTVLISGNLVEPRGIAIDPFRRRLFWTDVTENGSLIQWSYLDGTQRQLIPESYGCQNIISIQVSLTSGELCFTEYNTAKIKCIDPTSTQVRTIASNVTDPYGLDITNKLFYWTVWTESDVKSMNLNGEDEKTISSPLFEENMNGIRVVSDYCPVSYSPCATNNGGCPENTICLMNRQGGTCKVFQTLNEAG